MSVALRTNALPRSGLLVVVALVAVLMPGRAARASPAA